jgi:hypothetical protein
MSEPRFDPLTSFLRIVGELCAKGVARLDDVQRCARFAAERRAFTSRDDDVFISSYPRSGTTWLQLMTRLLLHGGGLEFRHINAVVPWYERSLALGRATARDFDALPSPRIFKSHLPYAWLPARGRLIYVSRCAAEVVQSYYGLYRSHLRYRGSMAEFTRRFVRGDLQYGSWHDHVAEWHAHADDPRVLLLRYEAMRCDPRAALVQMATFLEVDVAAERLDEILELSSLSTMKREEERFDHAADERFHVGMEAGRFIGEGQRGPGAQALTQEQRMLLDAHGKRPPARIPLTRLSAFLH